MANRLMTAFAGAGLMLAAILSPARAQDSDFPNRAIRLVIPYAAGGTTDIFGRAVADFLSRDLKQTVVVENKPGAQGNIGGDFVAKSPPDGYTLFLAAGSIVVFNPLLYKTMSFDPANDLRMLSLMTEVPMALIVHPTVPAKTVREFVDYSKANPGKVSFGSSGRGGSLHIAGEMLKYYSKADLTHVPYRGAAPALNDLLGGQLQAIFEPLNTALPHVKAGNVRILGITTTDRSKLAPDIPAIAELGYPDYRLRIWYGVSAPAKTPEPVAAKIAASLNKALNDVAFRESLEKTGFTIYRPRNAQEIKAFIDDERAVWTVIFKAQNITLE